MRNGFTHGYWPPACRNPSQLALLGSRIAPRFDGLLTLVRLWVKAVLGTADEDTIFLSLGIVSSALTWPRAQFFLSTGFTWDHFVDVLFNATAGLSDTVLPLGEKG